MPIKPKDSRLLGWGRVKARPQRVPKRVFVAEGISIASDPTSGTALLYNPPSSAMSPLVTPNAFLPSHLKSIAVEHHSNKKQAPQAPSEKTRKVLTRAEIEQIRTLRDQGQSKAQLAAQFQTTPFVVSLLAPVDKVVKDAATARLESVKAQWSTRKSMFREIRTIRKNNWGLNP